MSACYCLDFLFGTRIWSPFQMWWLFKFAGSQGKDRAHQPCWWFQVIVVLGPGCSQVHSGWRGPARWECDVSVKVLCWVFTLRNVFCQSRQRKPVLWWFEWSVNLTHLTIGPLKDFRPLQWYFLYWFWLSFKDLEWRTITNIGNWAKNWVTKQKKSEAQVIISVKCNFKVLLK